MRTQACEVRHLDCSFQEGLESEHLAQGLHVRMKRERSSTPCMPGEPDQDLATCCLTVPNLAAASHSGFTLEPLSECELEWTPRREMVDIEITSVLFRSAVIQNPIVEAVNQDYFIITLPKEMCIFSTFVEISTAIQGHTRYSPYRIINKGPHCRRERAHTRI